MPPRLNSVGELELKQYNILRLAVLG